MRRRWWLWKCAAAERQSEIELGLLFDKVISLARRGMLDVRDLHRMRICKRIRVSRGLRWRFGRWEGRHAEDDDQTQRDDSDHTRS